MVPLVGHRLYFEEQCVPLMICDCGAVQKLVERLAPAADGLSARLLEQMVALLLLRDV